MEGNKYLEYLVLDAMHLTARAYHTVSEDTPHRKTRWEELDDDFAYDPNQLNRDVVTLDQFRTIVRTFRDKLLTEREVFTDV